jgi:hypothetical protein
MQILAVWLTKNKGMRFRNHPVDGCTLRRSSWSSVSIYKGLAVFALTG